MLQFRRNAQRTLAAVRRGEPVLLTYRGRPVARLEPVRDLQTATADGEALLRIDSFAVDGPGGVLQNQEIDRILYAP